MLHRVLVWMHTVAHTHSNTCFPMHTQHPTTRITQTFVDGPSAKFSSSDKKESDKKESDKKESSEDKPAKKESSKKSKEEEEEVDAGESLERAKELVLASGVKDL